ncbi:YczE/YyaS/YitT family protein [Ruminococcus flavefaciens]|uniref:YczE/YyaS/YitT family protein n=1 Tax=Ruminococcus flavefaciens TaxID=1265 RepID=UPI0004B4EFE8|nr:membrane protein [Ruminococcus flavefaciens]
MKRRIIMSVLGVLAGAVSVAIFKMAAFGVDPFQSFMSGISKLVPISFGTLYVIVNVVLLAFSLGFDRHYIGIATFINLFLLGYVTEYSYKLLRWLIPEPAMPLRIVFLIIGIVIICIGSSLYITADLGVSTYDAVALIMANKWKIGQFKFIRVCTDLCCVVFGVVMFMAGGGHLREIPAVAGMGTIITAFFMGPLIEFFTVHIARKILNDNITKKA